MSHLVHLRLRLCDRLTGLQPCDHLEIGGETPAPDPLACGHKVWHPQLRRLQRPDRIGDANRHDANDLIPPVVERNRAAHDLGIRAEAAMPERIAQHRHAMMAVDFVVGREHTANRRPYPQHVEEARGHALCNQFFGLGAGQPKRGRSVREGGH